MSPREKGSSPSFVLRNPSQHGKKESFFLLNRSFFSIGVYLDQRNTVIDSDTRGNGLLINLVESAFSIHCASLNLHSYYPVY